MKRSGVFRSVVPANRRALVVEPDAEARALLCALAAELGFRAFTLDDWRDRAAYRDIDPDVVFAATSVLGFYEGRTPGRLPRLRGGEGTTPFVVLTCAPRSESRLALDIGAVGVLAKPLEPEPVAAAFRAVLRIIHRQSFRPRGSVVANAERAARLPSIAQESPEGSATILGDELRARPSGT